MTQMQAGGFQPTGGPRPAGLSIASMVLGIVSLVLFCFWYIAIPCAIIAVVLGFMAKGKIARGEASGGGMATTGVVLGIIALALAILIVILAAVGISMFGSKVIQMQKQMQQQAATRSTMMLHLHLESALRSARHLLRM